ncbi:MAG: YfiR family protein [Gammaproteobacteria bacterium]|nr:YfiR family protein [Gammaproteobacteria bacterium]
MNLRRLRHRLLLAILASCFCVPAMGDAVSDEDVKLALIYKITRFITWPTAGDQSSAPFRFCLAENTIFELAQDRLTGRRIRDRDIEVHLLSDDAVDLSDQCDVFYMARLKKDRVSQYLAMVAGQPVLTVSDVPDFAKNGGMIGLSTRSQKVGIKINVAAYESSDLVVSSQLLELADLIDDRRSRRK